MESRQNESDIGKTLVMVLKAGELYLGEQGARVDEMEAQRARAPTC